MISAQACFRSFLSSSPFALLLGLAGRHTGLFMQLRLVLFRQQPHQVVMAHWKRHTLSLPAGSTVAVVQSTRLFNSSTSWMLPAAHARFSRAIDNSQPRPCPCPCPCLSLMGAGRVPWRREAHPRSKRAMCVLHHHALALACPCPRCCLRAQLHSRYRQQSPSCCTFKSRPEKGANRALCVPCTAARAPLPTDQRYSHRTSARTSATHVDGGCTSFELRLYARQGMPTRLPA